MMKPWTWFYLAIPPALLITACGLVPSSADVIRGSGRVLTESRQVSGFDEIDVCCGMQLILSQGQAESLIIEAEDNILPEIVNEVSTGRLRVHFDNPSGRKSYRLTRPVRVTVSVIEIHNLVISGGGRLEAGPVESDRLSLEVSGGSRAELEQLAAESLEVEITGGGRFSAQDLQTGRFVLDLSGGSNASIRSFSGERIELDATGGGDVEVAGIVTQQLVSLSGGVDYQAGDLESEETDLRMDGGGRATVWTHQTLSADLSGGARLDYYGRPQVSQHLSGGSELVSRGDR
jgi:hypothetical protein